MELGNREDDLGLGGTPDDPLYHHRRQPQYHQEQDHPDAHAYLYVEYPPQYRPDTEYHSSHLDTSAINSRSTSFDAAQPAQVSSHTHSYADANANATATNGLSVDAVDPDDFYRSYGVDPNSLASRGHDSFMAAAPPTSRGNSSSSFSPPHHTSRPPSTAANSRTPLRSSLRSVSAPIKNDRPPVSMSRAEPGGKPSVKDLRKKFDQDTSSMIPRPPARSSLIHRPTHASRSKTTASPTGPRQPSSIGPRSSGGTSARVQPSTGPGPSAASKPPQRSKPSADHPQARSGASFASRINKPKAATEAGGSSLASRSTTRPSRANAPTDPSSPPRPSVPSQSSQPILFGEILPDQRDTQALGYGIENAFTTYGSDSKDPAPTEDSRATVPDSPSDWVAWNSPSNGDEKPSRRRKVSVGNIDFEQRREHVKLAYRKSIRQSRIQDSRERAAKTETMNAEPEAGDVAAEPENELTAEPETMSTPDQPTVMIDAPELDVPLVHTESEVPSDPAPAGDPQPALSPDGTIIVSLDSPTLGIPGSFPEATPPLPSDENAPQSAISTRSDFTEFDIEPQTDLDAQPSYAAVNGGHMVSESTRSDDTGEPRYDQDQYSVVEATSERQHSFETRSSRENDHAPEQLVVEIGLDLGEILSEKVPENAPEAPRSEGDDPSVPGAFKEDYEVASCSPDAYDTRVRILRRESDMSQYTVSDVGSERSKSAFPPFNYDDMEYRPEIGSGDGMYHIHQDDGDDALTDICAEAASEGRANNETCYSPEVYSEDNKSSNRASTCESFDATRPDALDGGLSMQQSTSPPHMLGVPSMLMSGNRSSQHSSWTDFSIDSSEPSEGYKTRSSTSRFDPPPLPKPVVDMYPETKAVMEEDSLSTGAQLRRSASLDAVDHEDGGVQPSPNAHRILEVDTGDGFSIPPYLHDRPFEHLESAHITRPLQQPPPIPTAPTSKDDEQRHTLSSSIYDRPGSTLDSERPSEDYTPGTSTPPSIRQGSLEIFGEVQDGSLVAGAAGVAGDGTESSKAEQSSKEKHRLTQRRNVLKELIDTEAVFVRDMNIVEEIYKGTAEACPKLDANTVKLIFRNTDEIISFHAMFLAQLKEAVAPVYQLAGRASVVPEDSRASALTASSSGSQVGAADLDDQKDRLTAVGPVFKANIDAMKGVHEGFLRSSDLAAKRLIQIQQDRTVKVWLSECNEVAQDLTAAWDLDSLLIKPMQRITKYPNIIISLLQHTPEDHPDRPSLIATKEYLETAIIEINKTKKNFELVGQIVGRKRKESDVKAGFARAFGKRVDKLQTSNSRSPDDAEYGKLRERFNDDYLRLQVVLRDVEFYTRQVSAYVHEFLQYLSSIELVMRLQASPFPEVESKWVQFNVSMRDVEKVALEQHLVQVRRTVIEPFELVIKAYGNPSLAMKKRAKRRLDFERVEQLKKGGKTPDARLTEQYEQYEALNDTLKKELPKLSELTVRIGNIAMGNFVNLQASWYEMWKDKVKIVLADPDQTPEIPDILSAFKRDYQYALDSVATIGIVNPTYKGRPSHSKSASIDEGSSVTKIKSRPPELTLRGRGPSVHGEGPPSLPTPDFASRNGEQFTLSPPSMNAHSPHHSYYRDYYAGINSSRNGGISPLAPDSNAGSRTHSMATTLAPDPLAGPRTHSIVAPVAQPRPGTGRSMDSGSMPRQSTDSSVSKWRDSSSTTYTANYGVPEAPRRFSGLFHSALPLPDEAEGSQRSSRASSRERPSANSGYTILWLAASLFEFNIETTKHEAGYQYLVYQAGEIFDVIAEKGELWLAKNQDDPQDRVGWIWSKHFVKLADS
ncbi:uncharacterized protein DNG_03674 [Cephalotrichum gorgonifer]|uniref:DH domain-containing protein n=1 Tax=Cephalotrichum gorgonifer TaxID=2041049 RepID=A0AAE8STU0_9PEZI|nr:uncharacterized protein DNG_03674 [Cephalotrichum gorgonifer]